MEKSSIEEIRAALGTIEYSAEDPGYYWTQGGREESIQAALVVGTALDELAALRVWRAQVKPLLWVLAARNTTWNGPTPPLVLQARAVLALLEAGNSGDSVSDSGDSDEEGQG